MLQTASLLRTLEGIGLSEKEASVYLALVTLQSATAYHIAQHCSVKKPTVYIILEELRKKGLVLIVPHAKKMLFAPRHLDDYLKEQQEHLRAAERIIPSLEQLSQGERAHVYFFNGLSGMKDALAHKFDAMKGKTFHSFFGNLKGASVELRTLYMTCDNRMQQEGIRSHIIMSKEESDRYYPEITRLSTKYAEQIKIRLLSQALFPPNISVEVGSDFVRITDATLLTATIIDDANTATAFRQIFQIVWEKGE